MKSPHGFLTKPVKGRRYDNIVKIGDIDFITSSSKEDHKASNRFAEVIETPIGYKGNIVAGDILLVHHNVFKYYNAMNGSERSGKSHLFDDLFLIDPEQYFMYCHDGTWHCDGRFSFVRPVLSDNSIANTGLKHERLHGEMVYPSSFATAQGLSKSDRLTFAPESEYEFEVDGEILYRIYDIHLTLQLQ